jgi:hypothetical protein
MCLTKLDVLDGLESLKLCTGYKLDGKTVDIFPSALKKPLPASRCTKKCPAGPRPPSAPSRWTLCRPTPALHQAYRGTGRRAHRHDLHRPGPRRDHRPAPSVQVIHHAIARKGTRHYEAINNMKISDDKDLWVSWDDYNRLIERLALKVYESGYQFDQVLCLARGGLRPGDVMSRIFDVPLAILSTSSYREAAGTIRSSLDIAKYITITKEPWWPHPAGGRPGRFRRHPAEGDGPPEGTLPVRHRDQECRVVVEGLLGRGTRFPHRLPADQPVDSPAVRRI